MTTEACSELTEGLLLYTSLQLNHLSRNSVKQLNPRLRVRLGPTGKAEEASNDREAPQLQREFQVQIQASGLGCYYLDGTSFLNTLCEHGFNFKRCVEMSSVTELELLCRCIGEHSSVSSCSIKPGPSPLAFQETVISRPEHFNPATVLIRFKVKWSSDQLKVELNRFLTHLHLMHITNPEIGLEFADLSQSSTSHTSGSEESECTLRLVSESFKHFPRTRIKLVTSLRHFYNNYSALPARLLKLHLLKGDAYTIPSSLTLTGGSKVTVKVHCTAAVVPHLSLRNGRKIPANRLCKHLHISVFGPSHLPLVSAGSQLSFPLTSLAEWDSFGMELRHCHSSTAAPDHLTVIPSYTFEISNLRAVGSSCRVSTSMSAKHHLELFMFLEDVAHQENSGLGKNCHWKRSIELHHRLRGDFQRLVVEHSKKFHQAVHSVLNKLVCNYGSHAKTKSIMSTVIPLVADAVASIVKNSTNDSFKESCRNIMKVKGSEETATVSWVTEKLWKLAGEKLGAAPPSDSSATAPNPDEPTSPELILAAGEHSNSESSTLTGSRDESTSTSSETHSERNDTKLNSNVSVTTACLTETHDGSGSSSGKSQAGLFQARIASNKALSQQNLTDAHDSNEDFDFEALSAFEDVVSSEGSVDSGGSDETVVSDFDELEEVSEGEVSFDDQSQPPSPVLLSTTSELTLTRDNVVMKNHHDSQLVGATVKESRAHGTTTTLEEAMDTQDMDETNIFSDEDCIADVVDYPQQVGTENNITNLVAGTALSCDETEQHVPGRWEQAKKPNDDSSDDDMSHTSDKEWTEMSFESPEFLHGNNSTPCVHTIHLTSKYTTISQEKHNILPLSVEKYVNNTEDTDNTEICKVAHCQALELRTDSAFDSLEDYDETLSVSEFETIQVVSATDTLTICNNKNSMPSTNDENNIMDSSHKMLTQECTLVGSAEFRMSDVSKKLEIVSDTEGGVLTCDVTDDDFCWDSEHVIES